MTTPVSNGLDLLGQLIKNHGTPGADTDVANKLYVDNVARGLAWKKPVRLAPTGNVTISSPGTTFDGKTANVNDALLLMNQTTQSENGLYVWTSGTAALVRRTDADDGTELQPGTAVTVTEGATYGDKSFIIISDGTVTIGTSSIQFGPLGGGTQAYTAVNGISLSGAQFSGVVKPSGGITVDSTGFALDTSIALRKVSGNVGNGSATSIDVAHNLGTLDIVAVTLRIAATNQMIIPDWTVKDANTITLNFPSAPATSAYRVSVAA